MARYEIDRRTITREVFDPSGTRTRSDVEVRLLRDGAAVSDWIPEHRGGGLGGLEQAFVSADGDGKTATLARDLLSEAGAAYVDSDVVATLRALAGA